MRSTARIQVTTKYLRSLSVEAMVFLVIVAKNKSNKDRNYNTRKVQDNIAKSGCIFCVMLCYFLALVRVFAASKCKHVQYLQIF